MIFVHTSTITLNAQWEQVSNNMYGANVSCIEFTDSNIYVGTYDSGIFMSRDDGVNWENISHTMINKEILDLAILNEFIFAATEHEFQVTSNNGITWKEIKSSKMSDISSLCVHKNILFAGDRNTGKGLWKSTDFGKNWEQNNSCLIKSKYHTDTLFIQIENIKSNGKSLFIGTLDFLYYSSNNGVCWNKIKYDTKYHSVEKIIFTKNDVILLASRYDVWGMKRKLFKANLNDLDFSEIGDELFEEYIVDVSYDNGMLYAVTDEGVYLSNNNGESWLPKFRIRNSKGITNKDNIILLYTWKDEIFKSSDQGKSFHEITDGIYGLFTGSLNFIDSQIIAGTSKGNFISNDLGEYWSRYYLSISNATVTPLLETNNDILAGTDNSGIYYSSNNGLNWVERNTGLKSLSINKLLHSKDRIFAATGDLTEESGLFYSTNYGLTWKKSKLNSKNDYSVHDIIDFNNILFAGTHSDGVYKSYDNGDTWVSARKGLDDYLSRIEILFSVNNKIFAFENSEGIYESNDMGENWYKISESPSDIKCIAVNNNTAFAGTYYHGVLKSSDECKTWEKITENTLLKSTWSLIIEDGYLFAGTNSNGVWRYKIK